MAQIIGLPKLSPTMEEGVLVRWVKREGDKVKPGDLVAEVETDKANMDFNLEDEGTLLKLLVKEGDTVKLGAPVAILGDAGEDVSALVAQAAAGGGGGAGGAAGNGTTAGAAAKTEAPAAAPAAKPADTPKPDAGGARGGGGGSGSGGGASAPPPGAEQPAAKGPLLASPLARTMAIDLGIDLRTVTGTGPGGRIVERDVRAAAEAPAPAPRPAKPPTPAPAPSADAAEVVEGGPPPTALALRQQTPPAVVPPSDEYVDKPLSNMRRRIAARLTEAKRDVPHFYLTRDFDAAPLLDFRQRLNTLLAGRAKVSVNDLLIKGVALALRRVPECNAAFVGEAIRYYTRVHIGVAVAIEEGLVTPVVRDADLKGIGVIGAEVKDLAERARSRHLKAHEITGSTFTISNLGMMDIEHFTAIINPPEAAILAVGATRDVAVVENGEVVAGKRMTFTMSCDHRVIDGAVGARYLKELVDLLEHPESLAL